LTGISICDILGHSTEQQFLNFSSTKACQEMQSPGVFLFGGLRRSGKSSVKEPRKWLIE
jgi:hypothetical protein